MNPKNLRYGFIALLALLAGCSKNDEKLAAAPTAATPAKPAVALVKEQEQSRHFLAVSRQLELGGTLYGYVDVDGDARKLSGGLQSALQQMAKGQPALRPVAEKNLVEIFQLLGVEDIKAVGVSSVPEGNGFFRNRAFVYMPDGRHGLLASLGGKAGPFTRLNLAPADTDFYAETEMDLPVLYKTVKEVVAKVSGEPASNQMDAALKKAGEAAALSVLDLIYGLKGHAAIVLKFDPQKNLHLPIPGGAVMPAFSLLIAVDGIGQVIEPVLAKSPMLKMSQAGSQHLYESRQPLPIEGIQPVIVVDGGAFFIATSREFLAQCREQKTGLGDTPEFRAALAQVGAEGNGLTYLHPRFFTRLQEIETLNPNLPEDAKATLHFVMSNLPTPNQPLIAVRTNLPEGILIRSHWNRSLKQDVAMVSVYNPVTVGVLAAMAIPAFQKVRTASQQKAVLNNLRQFAAAGDQYCLENGVDHASYSDLVGPGKYIKVLTPVAGENYTQLKFVQGEALHVRLANGQRVDYSP